MVPAGEHFVKRNPFRCGVAAAEGAFLHKKASQSLRPQAQIKF